MGKFKNADDVQGALVQKVTLLEIQRRKIQKIFDEWALYYPHYMASIQVKWLRSVFGQAIHGEVLNSEYWKCVGYFKRVISGANAFVQKYMGEIASCVNRISAALPEDTKRVDVTNDLRITSVSASSILTAGSDIMMGVSAGLEMANIFVRGFTATSPLTLSLSAKALVDSYTKDVALRKDVKAFGLQALEWWRIFMSGVCVQIIEVTNSIHEYNKECLKRDTELFKKFPEAEQTKIRTRLSALLKNKISESIDDKFIEVLPQFNMRIANIIDLIDANRRTLDSTLNDFKKNLFI